MALDKTATKKVLQHIDRDELARLGCDLTSIPSPTGQEKAIAEFILHWFASNGLKAVRQDVEVDRPNAVGVLKGDGNGLSLGWIPACAGMSGGMRRNCSAAIPAATSRPSSRNHP